MPKTDVGCASTLDELAALVCEFETCQLPQEQWDHAMHLTVAAWYTATLTGAEATDCMIKGILRYNHAHGIESTPTGGYHETITLFWLTAVRAVLDRSQLEPDDIVGRVDEVCRAYADRRDVLIEFYEREALFSSHARTRWVPPTKLPNGDLAPLSRAFGAGATDRSSS